MHSAEATGICSRPWGDLVTGTPAQRAPSHTKLHEPAWFLLLFHFNHNPESWVQKLPPPTHSLANAFAVPAFSLPPAREGRVTPTPSHGHRWAAAAAAARGRTAAPTVLITRQKAHQQQNHYGKATLGSLPEQPQQWSHCSAASSLPRATHIFPTPGRSQNLPAQ